MENLSPNLKSKVFFFFSGPDLKSGQNLNPILIFFPKITRVSLSNSNLSKGTDLSDLVQKLKSQP